jgi:signal transduction histidine kinase
MEQAVSEYIQMCQWDSTNFLIFSDNVFGHLVYYSHLLPLVAALWLAGFAYLSNRKVLATKWLFATSVLLGVWLFSDLVLWATDQPSYTMFFWSMLVLIEPMIYAGMLLFVYAFLNGRNLPFGQKLLVFILLLPTILLTPTDFALTHYDLTNCWREAIEGPLAFYGYILEIVFALWILVLGMEGVLKSKSGADKSKAALITFAAVLFLLSFAMGNVVGSLLVDWQIGQYGLFGIPVFMAILSYLIVRYHVFNIKLIATQLLVSIIWVLTLGILFVQDIGTVRTIVFITLAFFTVLGNLLVKSVKREVKLREQLQEANEGQANLLHIINHQIKGYMTKARLVFNDLLEDQSYCLTQKTQPLIMEGFDSMTEGVNFVQDFLNSSNIERGTFTYTMAQMDLEDIVKEVAASQHDSASEKGLRYELKIKPGDYHMTGDKAQLNQAIRNLIDNSIKYTPKGSLVISLERKLKSILFKVSDTGVGLSEEVKPKLFTKGGRDKDSQKINVNSTGFGLAFVKGVAEAHKGRVWAESKGVGKGSTFFMELPVA